MELLNRALEISRRQHVGALDYAWTQENVVEQRVNIVCAHVAKLFVDSEQKELQANQVAKEPLSGGDSFSSVNPADLALLVFEVIAERNRNPRLWEVRGPAGIDAEINNTICKFLYGPSTLGGDVSQGIKESNYTGAKQKLIHNLHARLF